MEIAIFLAKVLALSAVISGLIKFVLPAVNIPATATVSLSLVLLPTVLLGGLLGGLLLWQQHKT
ncbi:MAG: hypothetical protein F6J97_03655 [Leptolyngbya sp. SIO4C1]|nr:hypothetical protein [Leptolyngbya sp. SIO4C1]